MPPNPFLAFRTAAFSVLHVTKSSTTASPTSAALVLRRCPQDRALFHSTPITASKQKLEFDLDSLKKKRVPIPEHKPVPKPLRGKKIPHEYVHVLDPKTQRYGPVQSLQALLDSVNPDEYLMELVDNSPPTVKIVDLKASRAETLKERLKAKAGGKGEVIKEANLTWSMMDADYQFKVAKIREFLEKGWRVDVEYSTKKGMPLPTWAEATEKVQALIESLQDIAKEMNPTEVHRRKSVISLQSKVTTSNKIDINALKESVPKHVLQREERKLRAEKHKQQNTNQPLETYNDLWGV